MQLTGVVEGINQFALDLYQELRPQKGNLFFSPGSISMALAMAYAGAAGETAAEMARSLHFEIPNHELHEGMRALQADWRVPDETQSIRLSLAQRLWGSESYEFLPAFLQITRQLFGAEPARLDFSQTEVARQTINGWIEEQTEHKITDAIPAGALDADTKLVLSNAVYFRGTWADPFDKSRTQDEDFHLTTTDRVTVPLMHRVGTFRYIAIGDIQIVELPYGDGSLSMFVVLPREIDGLAALEERLTFENLRRWMCSMIPESDVSVQLPGFKTASRFPLIDTLRALGIRLAFDDNAADFSAMTGSRELFLSAVIHNAFVDVNEEGTEAAASTSFFAGLLDALPRKPPVFRADHPFVFLIQDNRNGVILFMGRLTDPLS